MKKKLLNTEIYLWLEPLILDRKTYKGKLYFNCIVEGDYSQSSKSELEDIIEGRIISSIMDYADITINNDYGVISAKTTTKSAQMEFTNSLEEREKAKLPLPKKPKHVEIKVTISPEERKKQSMLKKIIASKKPIVLTKKEVIIKENGQIEISLPSIDLKQNFDFAKIWCNIEKNFLGKIKEGDVITLTDDLGNKIIEVLGGSFLNVGLADLSVYDAEKKSKSNSFFDSTVGLKGGLFVRDDGSMDIGDMERTFYLKIYTNNMLKQSLKLDKSLNEISDLKLDGLK